MINRQLTAFVSFRLKQQQKKKTKTVKTIATKAKKIFKTITDNLTLPHFHFSNLKRPLVIKVRCRTKICKLMVGVQICRQFRFKPAGDNYYTGRRAGMMLVDLVSWITEPWRGYCVVFWARHFTLSVLPSTHLARLRRWLLFKPIWLYPE